jgi:hypothetical protein
MANCPNCGSSDIQLKTDSRQNVNWGRAIAGWALFGVVGGAVGAVTGKGKSETITANVCLNCGTIWDAATLYKLLQHIKFLTGVELDLSQENDRDRMNIFIREIQPLVDKVQINRVSSGVTLNLSGTTKRNFFIVGAVLLGLGIFAINKLNEYKNGSIFLYCGAMGISGIGAIFLALSIPSFSGTGKTKANNYQVELDRKIGDFVANT